MAITLRLKQNTVPITLFVQSASGGGGEIYTGAYEVIPDTVEQVLQTKNKSMVKDFTVHEIPYAETSNQYGTTVVICS